MDERLLTLDLGFTTGFSVVERGKAPITGSKQLPGSVEELGLTCHHLGHFLKDLIEEHKPTGIVLCTPFIGTFAFKTKTGLGRVTPDINPIKLLFGLFGMAMAVAHAANIPVYEVYEPTVRAEFGIKVDRKIKDKEKRRKALKDSVMLACTSRHWYVCDDHAGDAMLAGAYQLGKLLLAVVQPLLFATKPRRRARKKAA
jgi:hypothetical protein